MKKLLFLSAGFCFISLFTSAQTLSITGFGGYTFQEKVNFSNAYGYINESGHWGVSVEGISRTGHGIELLYQQQRTHTPLYFFSAPNTQINPNADQTTISYIMLNAIQYFRLQKIQPYGAVGLGVAIVDNESYGSQTKFAWDAKIGVKLKASPRLGIKVQAQLYSIVQAAGGELYAGTGGGGLAVNSYTSVYQFSFCGGLCLDFSKKQLPK